MARNKIYKEFIITTNDSEEIFDNYKDAEKYLEELKKTSSFEQFFSKEWVYDKNSGDYEEGDVEVFEEGYIKEEYMSTETEKKDDSILIESIKVEANRWFDKTYGNTYHQARAIINGEYVVSQDKSSYGGESHYETTILKDLINAGVLNIGETNSLWRFCEENGIEYYTSHSDGLKRDLPFKDNHLYTDAKGLKFKIKSNEAFDEIVKAIEHNFKDESNISKALRVCIEAQLCDVKIPNLVDRVNTLYKTDLKEASYSMVHTSDARALKEVVDAVKNKTSMFDFSKEITLARIYEECSSIYKDKLSPLKTLNVVGKSTELLEMKIENIDEKIKGFEVKDSEASVIEDKPKTKKQR